MLSHLQNQRGLWSGHCQPFPIMPCETTHSSLSIHKQTCKAYCKYAEIKSRRGITVQNLISVRIFCDLSFQAWSITYVSWLTFVFLIWSCTLWMVRDRRRYAMLSSPFMVAYGNLLIVLQYIWSFENMEPISGLFVKKNNPFHSLSSKVWDFVLDIAMYFQSIINPCNHQPWPLLWVTICNLKTSLWFSMCMATDVFCMQLMECILFVLKLNTFTLRRAD